jgi:hypothetical protein
VAKSRRTTGEGNGEAFGGVFFRAPGESSLQFVLEYHSLMEWILPVPLCAHRG